MAGLEALRDPLLICNEDHRFIVAEQMRQIEVALGAILLEPMGLNTAPETGYGYIEAPEPFAPGA